MIKMITTGYFEVLPPGVRDSGHIVIPRVIWWENTESLLKGFTELIQAALKDTRMYDALSEVRVVRLEECSRDEYETWKSRRDRKWGSRSDTYIRRAHRNTLGTGVDYRVIDSITMFEIIEKSNMRMAKNEEVL